MVNLEKEAGTETNFIGKVKALDNVVFQNGSLLYTTIILDELSENITNAEDLAGYNTAIVSFFGEVPKEYVGQRVWYHHNLKDDGSLFGEKAARQELTVLKGRMRLIHGDGLFLQETPEIPQQITAIFDPKRRPPVVNFYGPGIVQ